MATLDRRRAGVILHPTSLPSGCLDEDAARFLEFMESAGFSVWQMLPLGPVGVNGSPYSLSSAFAGNPALIPNSLLAAQVSDSQLRAFRVSEQGWLRDYALWSTIRMTQNGKPWWQWPPPLKQREESALKEVAHRYADEMHACELEQCRFALAWQAIREQARDRGILLYGDIPMFVVADSADVWASPTEFRLDDSGIATHVAGVPPDAFTELGQCWDNPLYDWEHMRKNGFSWWKKRLAHECRRFDLLRWDHFRGLSATWEIPVHPGRTAAQGQWQEVPGHELLSSLQSELGPLPLVAENLGVITAEVEQLRNDFGLPGMHVLQFAFDGTQDNPHLPMRHEEQGVVYTGTHDNDTSLGWFKSLSPEIRQQVMETLSGSCHRMPDALVQAAMESPCRLAVEPMQDLLRLDSEARMNTPGKAEGQWRWQFSWQQLNPSQIRDWRRMVGDSDRS